MAINVLEVHNAFIFKLEESEDGEGTFFLNVGQHIPDYTAHRKTIILINHEAMSHWTAVQPSTDISCTIP
jgi:hypothetical protein